MKRWQAMALFSDWSERSGAGALVEWVNVEKPQFYGEKEMRPVRDEAGEPIVPTAEMVTDYILQVSERRQGA